MKSLEEYKKQTRESIVRSETSILENIRKLAYATGYDSGLVLAESILSKKDVEGLKATLDVYVAKLKERGPVEKNTTFTYPSSDDFSYRLKGVISGIVDGAKVLNNLDLSKHQHGNEMA